MHGKRVSIVSQGRFVVFIINILLYPCLASEDSLKVLEVIKSYPRRIVACWSWWNHWVETLILEGRALTYTQDESSDGREFINSSLAGNEGD